MNTPTRHDQLFRGRMNIRYHEALERRYGNWINWTSFVSLLLSSAAFVALVDAFPPDWKIYKDLIVGAIALSAAIMNGVLLSFGMLGKFSIHADLKREWIHFLGRLDAATDEQLPEIDREFHAICAREPAVEPKLLDRAFNDACIALDLKPNLRSH